MIRVFLNILIILSLGVIALPASAGGDIQVQHPWVQAAPPGIKVMAAYLVIKNNSKEIQTLTSVSSPAFDQAGIHRSVMHGDMAHMEHLKELPIHPYTAEVFKPGGLHLMLTGPRKKLQIGDQVPIILTFKDGRRIPLEAAVRSGQTGEMDDRRHMDHSGHESHKP